MGLFGGSKSQGDKEFEKQFKFYVGGFFPSDYFIQRRKELEIPKGTIDQSDVKDIMMCEHANGKLSTEDIPDRLDELFHINCESMKNMVLDNGYDTSLIKTPEELNDFLVYAFGKEYDKDFRRQFLFEKYDVNPEGAYCFDAGASCIAAFPDNIVIIREAERTKPEDMYRKIDFSTLDNVEYHVAKAHNLADAIILHPVSGKDIKIKYAKKEDGEEVIKRFNEFNKG